MSHDDHVCSPTCGHDHGHDHRHGPRHIYIYSPSSAVRDKAAFRRGVARLKALGHEVGIDETALSVHTRFAGDDATRLAAIGRAAASGADVALISRGGYGLTRILGELPFKAITKAIERGTQFVGLSDFTAFQMALLAKTGAVTWAGPALGEDFGAEAPDDIMEACFDDLLVGHGEGAGWTLPVADAKVHQNKKAADKPFLFKTQGATLWGGNLNVICALVGTPHLPAIKGGILFLEDANEHPYRIERQLTQLLNAGIIGQQKAVLLGSFNRFKLVPGYDRGFKLQTVIDWLRTRTKTPVFTGLPFGHVPTKVLLPVGRKVDMMVEGRDALIYWG
ncbi:LD-carboxypeptidase [Hydrogenophaga sp.]|uniref:LD-carboxypeptidase n=1 Tax=Hydrogenophaga sp. TaxID=1904254 RepID=UPI00271661F8|nr:LD-carboxypeptidase [Hydrogenophaga sp.]MDO9438880.1 LD-carboxypeptidase [Hydrogenophaga sp.]